MDSLLIADFWSFEFFSEGSTSIWLCLSIQLRSITQVRSRNWCCVLKTNCIHTLNHILNMSCVLSYNSVEILLVSWWYRWYTDILTNYWFCYLSTSTFSIYRLLICLLRHSIRFINAVFCNFSFWNERYLNFCCFHHINNNSCVSRQAVQSVVTVPIQKVILERFSRSNPVPAKKVVLAWCINKIDFVSFSHQAHKRDALIQVPGKDFWV